MLKKISILSSLLIAGSVAVAGEKVQKECSDFCSAYLTTRVKTHGKSCNYVYGEWYTVELANPEQYLSCVSKCLKLKQETNESFDLPKVEANPCPTPQR